MYVVLTIGGILFWLLVAAELIFLYFCMGLEKTRGANATASLLGFVTLLACFSDLKTWALEHLGFGTLAYAIAGVVVYVLIGIYWSVLRMWPRWGKKRALLHKKRLVEWLENQGIRGDVCPDELKPELNLVVFGNLDQEKVERELDDVKDTYRRFKGLEYSSRATNRVIPPNLVDEFLNLVTQQDPETLTDAELRKEISELRKTWLKTQRLQPGELGIVIPERLMSRFTERVRNPYSRREPDVRWADVASEPLFRSNKSRLLTWFAYWPVSMAWYAVNDLLIDFGHWIVESFAGIGQGLMHRQYKDVRADFEVNEDNVQAA